MGNNNQTGGDYSYGMGGGETMEMDDNESSAIENPSVSVSDRYENNSKRKSTAKDNNKKRKR